MELPGAVEPELAEARRDRLLIAQRNVVDHRASALVGAEDVVLLEKPLADDPALWEGRARRQAPDVDGKTWVTGIPESAGPGEFVSVRYTGAEDYDMVAEMTGVTKTQNGI